MRIDRSTNRYRFAGYCALILLASCTDPDPEPQTTEVEIRAVMQRALENLVHVEGGSFMLGDIGVLEGRPYTALSHNEDNKPPVEVFLDSYSISKYETTWGDFVIYLEDLGRAGDYTVEAGFAMAHVLPITSNNDPLSPNYSKKPVRSPNYREARGYCAWLAEKSGLPFSLPTEAQWEFAARNRGQEVPYATDDGTERNDTYLQRPREHIDPSIPPSGNMLSHASTIIERRPVGSYPPSPLGIYDMSGNVAEWTRDWYHANAYQQIAARNPDGPDAPINSGKPMKVVRDWAGHGDHIGGSATVFARGGKQTNSHTNGFRCVVNQPTPVN